mmetsp:Transcript_38019/g.109050  ORF Transcript_38019/g.109050 Transcript_38019/m.109050 type:complete len:173 (-) Transcript_38019:300-818(-)
MLLATPRRWSRRCAPRPCMLSRYRRGTTSTLAPVSARTLTRALGRSGHQISFSYAHRRHVSLESPYPDVRFAEDAPFLLGLRNLYGSDKVALLRDEIGICVHIMHRANSAQVLGAYDIDEEDIDELAIAKLTPFKLYRAAASLAAQQDESVVGSVIRDVIEALRALVWAEEK